MLLKFLKRNRRQDKLKRSLPTTKNLSEHSPSKQISFPTTFHDPVWDDIGGFPGTCLVQVPHLKTGTKKTITSRTSEIGRKRVVWESNLNVELLNLPTEDDQWNAADICFSHVSMFFLKI